MKNSQGWSSTWPSIGKGIIGGGKAGAPPVLLFPERYGLCPGLAHGLAPSPFPSRPAPPPRAQEEEGRAVEP